VSTPHDALFKYVFSQPSHAASELAAVLPAELVRRIDWASLALEHGTFVDERLSDRHSDLLFSVRCDGRDALLYVLFEHQSSPDRLMPFRLLRYLVRIWDRFLEKHPDAPRLPAVLPVVLHHGDSGWNAPTDLHALIDLDPGTLAAAAPLLPQLRFLLDDVSRVDEEGLRARSLTALATAALMMLARARSSPNLVAELGRWLDVLGRVLEAPNAVAALSALIEYAFRVAEVPPEEFRQLLHQLGPAADEAYMTTAQKLTEKARQEALEKGRAEGRAEGRAGLLLRQLGLRFGALPEEVAARVRSASPELLELWAERVLTAQSLEDVLR